MDLIIESRAVAPFHKNGYVVACGRTRHAVLIDRGDEVDALLRIVEAERLSIASILLTHAHVDHVSGVARAKRATGAPVRVYSDVLFLACRTAGAAFPVSGPGGRRGRPGGRGRCGGCRSSLPCRNSTPR